MTRSHRTLLPPIRAPPSTVDACDPDRKKLPYNGLPSATPPHPHELDFDAMCSLRQDQVDKTRSLHGIVNGYTDYRQMLERKDLDAVVVASPDRHHFEPARAVLESGKHAVVEKPFTTSTAEADELIRISKRVGKSIQVAFNHRWLGPYYQTKVSIESGQTGMPLAGYARKNDTIFVATDYVAWAGETTPAWFLSSYDIDLMRWWLASEPVEARAWGRKEALAAKGIPTYDVIQAQVKFASGAFVTFESACVYPTLFPRSSIPSWKSSGPRATSISTASANPWSSALRKSFPIQNYFKYGDLRAHAWRISGLP